MFLDDFNVSCFAVFESLFVQDIKRDEGRRSKTKCITVYWSKRWIYFVLSKFHNKFWFILQLSLTLSSFMSPRHCYRFVFQICGENHSPCVTSEAERRTDEPTQNTTVYDFCFCYSMFIQTGLFIFLIHTWNLIRFPEISWRHRTNTLRWNKSSIYKKKKKKNLCEEEEQGNSWSV